MIRYNHRFLNDIMRINKAWSDIFYAAVFPMHNAGLMIIGR